MSFSSSSSSSPTPSRAGSLVRRVLTVLLVVLPLLELFVLFSVSRLVGGWWTAAIIISTTIIGGLIIRREGLRSWRNLREATRSAMPERSMTDSGLIMAGGFLLVLPGFISNIIGLLLILPFTRPIARTGMAYLVARKVGVPIMRSTTAADPSPGTTSPRQTSPHQTWTDPGRSNDRPGAGTTIRGDVIE